MKLTAKRGSLSLPLGGFMQSKHTPEYIEYLRSAEWRKKRAEKLAIVSGCEHAHHTRYRRHSDGTIEEIGVCFGELQVHHIRYDNLGHEPLADLLVLCEHHHAEADDQRRLDLASRQYAKRVDGFASKKYGDDWMSYYRFEDVEDEFDRWLENKAT